MTLKLNTMYGQSEIVVKKIEGLIVQHVTKTTAPAVVLRVTRLHTSEEKPNTNAGDSE